MAVSAVSWELAGALDSTQGTVMQRRVDLYWTLALGNKKGRPQVKRYCGLWSASCHSLLVATRMSLGSLVLEGELQVRVIRKPTSAACTTWLSVYNVFRATQFNSASRLTLNCLACSNQTKGHEPTRNRKDRIVSPAWSYKWMEPLGVTSSTNTDASLLPFLSLTLLFPSPVWVL